MTSTPSSKRPALSGVALLGVVEAGLSAMYTATHPDRVTALVLANVAASGGIVKDDERRELLFEMVENHWGEGHFITLFAPSRTGDPRSADSWTRFDRSCMNPAMARQLIDLNARIESQWGAARDPGADIGLPPARQPARPVGGWT